MTDLAARIRSCRACGLYQTRNQPVVGEGFEDSGLMLIAEAPGADEDRVGRPFVGPSGRLLDRILAACGFERDRHVYISNIVKCRPPGNRAPKDDEAAACLPFLHEQIASVDPRIIVTLGATALKYLLGDASLRITRVRGTWMDWNGRRVMPVYHPSALLRNPSLKRDTWEDFKAVVRSYRDLVDPAHHSDYV